MTKYTVRKCGKKITDMNTLKYRKTVESITEPVLRGKIPNNITCWSV